MTSDNFVEKIKQRIKQERTGTTLRFEEPMALHFTTFADVAAQLSGHLDRFPNPKAFDEACRLVWIAARPCINGLVAIDKDYADFLMDRSVEGTI